MLVLPDNPKYKIPRPLHSDTDVLIATKVFHHDLCKGRKQGQCKNFDKCRRSYCTSTEVVFIKESADD